MKTIKLCHRIHWPRSEPPLAVVIPLSDRQSSTNVSIFFRKPKWTTRKSGKLIFHKTRQIYRTLSHRHGRIVFAWASWKCWVRAYNRARCVVFNKFTTIGWQTTQSALYHNNHRAIAIAVVPEHIIEITFLKGRNIASLISHKGTNQHLDAEWKTYLFTLSHHAKGWAVLFM